ncbi:MAG: proline--tRNA ligase [Bdellovibrionaceae bacterium]|jgi:prolyl-tRNA synthetase|nr:proline--tRNA ligase [Pseudobdellovibrionaceae bacterium]
MKWTKSFTYTLKESPADAEITSHKLMVRAGMIRKLAPGLYTYGTMALRSIKKFEQIVREELEKIDCAEILMPIVHPKELWEETGRWQEMGQGLARFKNRNSHEFCLAATHEEAVTDYVRRDIKSYRDLPISLFQVQTKFRDEIRPRFGLMRGREFIMKDAYTFDLDEAAAIKSYDQLFHAYKNIFQRVGVDFRIVDADSGNIGGNKSQEFHVLADSGEDHLMVSTEGDYAANIEVCPAIDVVPFTSQASELPMEKFETKGLKKISTLSKALKIAEKDLVKSLYFSTVELEEGSESLSLKELKPICVLLRGSDELNPIKLKNSLGLINPPMMLTDTEVNELTGAYPGSCGPVNLEIPIYLDKGLEGYKNFIVGANENNFHLKNVNFPRDFKVTDTVDLRMAREGDLSPMGKGTLKSYRGIEVGHIFYLGTKYSKAMKANYLDAQGKSLPVEMGCYGIGISRTVQAAIEQSNDKDGIIWPKSIAPYMLHICHLDPNDEAVNTVATDLYGSLMSAGVEVFMDDREERPGVKFKDADLLGFPYRLVIGKKGVDKGEVELVHRSTKEKQVIQLASATAQLIELLSTS